jgi:hypothetical protein
MHKKDIIQVLLGIRNVVILIPERLRRFPVSMEKSKV